MRARTLFDTPFGRRIKSIARPAVARWRATRLRIRIRRFKRRFRRELPQYARRFDTAAFPDALRNRLLAELSASAFTPTSGARPETVDVDTVFLVRRLTPDILKDIIALKAVNPTLRVAVLAQADTLTASLRARFIDVFVPWNDALNLLDQLQRIQAPVLVLTRRGGAETLALAAAFWNGGRLVYRPYPFAHRTPDEIAARSDLEAERYVMERADAVYHFFNDDVRSALAPLAPLPATFVQVLPGCIDELLPPLTGPDKRAANDELHVAYAAGLFRKGHGGRASATGYIVDIPQKFRALLDAGAHLHVYTPYIRERDLHPDLAELSVHPRYHLRGTLEYTELQRAITQFHWGFYHFGVDERQIRRGFEWFASNGFFTLIEAGLPVIVSPSTPAYAELTARHGLGVVVEDKDFPRIGELLRRQDYAALRRNVLAAREHLRLPKELVHFAVTGETAEVVSSR